MFRPRTPPEAIDLVSKLLEYTPAARLNPMEACAHPFFNELRQQDAKMPNGVMFPPLFNFTQQGEREGERESERGRMREREGGQEREREGG